MNIFNWIFGKGKEEKVPQRSGNGQPAHGEHEMARDIEEVKHIGLTGNPFTDPALEKKYMREHPCNCGGMWERRSGGVAANFYISNCKCQKCGSEKQFLFYF